VRASAELAESWRSRVGAADLEVIRGTWERFGPPLYGDPMDWSRETAGA
jgi:hypothetical protein